LGEIVDVVVPVKVEHATRPPRSLLLATTSSSLRYVHRAPTDMGPGAGARGQGRLAPVLEPGHGRPHEAQVSVRVLALASGIYGILTILSLPILRKRNFYDYLRRM
jgi:hypothetical protein